MVEQVLQSIEPVLTDAQVQASEIEEVRALLSRPPEEVAVAVLGPHNAGKTTLIAAVTDAAEAKDDIGPVVMTEKSKPYAYDGNETRFVLWDTPGLGSEHLDHDVEARDRVTRADAVVLAVSQEGVSERGRDQLDRLLTIGRKRGAVLFVITKADREAEANRAALLLQMRSHFPDFARDPLFVAAGEVLDAREDGDPESSTSGLGELTEALESLAVGEARTRMRATAAIRVLGLIDDAEAVLSASEPEQEAALILQRRLRKLIRRVDRRVTEASGFATRKARLAAVQASASVASALEQRLEPVEGEKIAEDAWQTFTEAAARMEEDLAESLAEELRKATEELSRLDQGSLASALRHTIDDLDAHAYGDAKTADPRDLKAEKALLDAVQRAAKLLKGAKFMFKGKALRASAFVDVGAEALDWYVANKEAAAIAEAKEAVRAAYLGQHETLTDRWDDYVGEIRDATTRRLLLDTERVEEELFARHAGTQDQQRRLRNARMALDHEVDLAITGGYADAGGGQG